MTYEVVVLPKAERQLTVVDSWWRANRLAAPDLFSNEFQRALARLAVFPDSGHIYAGTRTPVRYLLMPASRYLVYYRVDEVHLRVRVLAVHGAVRGTQPRF